MTRICTVLLLSVFLTAAAFAQASGRLAGRVTREDGSGLSGVIVTINELGQATVTDNNGNYSFDNVAAGSYTVVFTAGDQAETLSNVTVSGGSTTRADKTVDWQLTFAESITVYSASRRVERIVEAPAAVTVVTEAELRAESPTGQLPKVLETAPGVDFTQSGLYDFNFNARGFNSSLNRRILTLIDGRDPSVPFLGAQEWAALSFPIDEMASVELVRGPGSALYGANAFNGVLNMVTKQPRYSPGGKVQLSGGDLGTGRLDFRHAGPITGDWFYRVVGGYQQSDDFTRSRNAGVEYGINPAGCTVTTPGCLPREAVPLALTDVEVLYTGLRLDRYFEEDAAAFTAEGGYATLEGPTFQTGIGRVQVTDVQRPWLRLNYNRPHWNLLGYWDARNADNQVALGTGRPLYEDSHNTHGEIQTNWDLFGGRARFVGGGAYNQQEVDTADPQGNHTLMLEAKSEHQQALFGQVDFNILSNLKAVLAARWDDSTLHDPEFSPKASLVYTFLENHSIRLNYNEAFQVPNYSEFFLFVPAGAPVNLSAIETGLGPLLGGVPLGFGAVPVLAIGNENLEVEQITSNEIGYSGIFGGKLYVTLDYYRNDVENFVTDLLGGVNPSFGPYQPPAALQPQVAAVLLNTLRANLPPAIFRAFTNFNGSPAIVLSYTNAGKVETQGAEIGFNYYLTDHWLLDANYSWFDFEVKEQTALGDVLLPNAPETKFNLGVSYRTPLFDVGLKYRSVDAFDWAAGIFVGPVPSYDVVNLTGSYRFGSFTFGINISNAADNEHWESFGGDILERRALGYLSYQWGQ
jgi:outer membrane receptor for ferrienterochelin and colicins